MGAPDGILGLLKAPQPLLPVRCVALVPLRRRRHRPQVGTPAGAWGRFRLLPFSPESHRK